MNKVEQLYQSISSRRTIEEVKSISELQYSYSNREPTRNELLAFIKSRGLEEDMRQFIYKDIHSISLKKELDIVSEQLIELEEGINLRVEILKGDCFYDYEAIHIGKSLKCEIALLGQRVVTKEVAVSIMPTFCEEFIFRLTTHDGIEKLVNVNTPLQFVLLERNNETQEVIILSVKRVEWRKVLYSKNVTHEIIFNRMDLRNKYPVGLIKVRNAISQ